MNSLRDPFSLRNKPAFAILHQNLRSPLLSIRSEVAKAQAAARPAIETAVGKFDETLEKLDEFAMSSFSIPKNVPSFTSPNREYEDVAWASVKGHSPRSPRGGGMSMSNIAEGAVGGLFGRDRDLPLYKDKPYYKAGAQRKAKRKWLRKRIFLLFSGVLFGLWWFEVFSASGVALPHIPGKNMNKIADDWDVKREKVKEVFVQSWDAYEKHAWGFDEFHPVSKKGRQMVPKGMGWIIIDALDTLMLMNLTTQLSHATEWVSQSLTFDQDHEVNTFETTIRMLGGLLSAHYLSNDLKIVPPGENDDLFLEKATDLADRLLGAFGSPSGIPYASVNLHTMAGIVSHADGGASSTAEAATLQLEMKYLSKLIGETLYWKKAEKVIQVLDNLNAPAGLVPIFIYADRGEFRGKEVRLGSRGDSYYEYLIKQYLQTNKKETVYLDMYNDAMTGVKKHLVAKSHPSHLTFIGELPQGVGDTLSPKMDHLVCFMPGSFALGATEGLTVAAARAADGGAKWGTRQEEDLKLARELMRTCYEMYHVTPTGLAPEIAWFNMQHDREDTGRLEEEDTKKDIIVKPRDSHNLLRPETVESLFVMWRITGDVIYREWGWNIFEALVKHTAVDGGSGGYASIDSVLEIPTKLRDNMESFWLAETLKYLYLLFSPNDLLPLDKIVFNTEAHPFPRFDMGRNFETGWKRIPRDAEGNLVKEPTA